MSAIQHQNLAVHGNVEGRFRNNEELRYNLRAIERFFPDHGHIYVVTDSQKPEWLLESENLTVVDHRDLIPADRLPVFDSGNIESYIHRIPGLSERFFYLNDDVFFGSMVNLDDWFYPGGIYASWSDEKMVTDEPMRADATSLENACRLSHDWLRAHSPHVNGVRKNGVAMPIHAKTIEEKYSPVFRTFAHSPRPMLRSRMYYLEHIAPELFESVRSTVFRRWDKPTIVSDFVIRWALASGQARLSEHSHIYVSAGDGGNASLKNVLADLVKKAGRLDFFCINDTADDADANDPRLQRVRCALQAIFSEPSGFELSLVPGAYSKTDQLMSVA